MALLHGPHQFMQMPDTTLRGGVREQAVALLPSVTPFTSTKCSPSYSLQTEVQPGIPVTVLRVDGDSRLPLPDPLGKNAVGGLSVHVDEPVTFSTAMRSHAVLRAGLVPRPDRP